MFIIRPCDIDLLVRNIYAIKRNTQPILRASRNAGLGVKHRESLSIKNLNLVTKVQYKINILYIC